MRAMAALIALFAAAACSEPSERSQTAVDTSVCLVDLVFPDEDARVAFLRENAGVIADVTSTGVGLFATDPSLPEMKLIARSDCQDFDGSHLGLEVPEGTLAGADDTTYFEASEHVSAFLRHNVRFNQSTSMACVVRIAPPPDRNTGDLMNALALGGLRGAFVTGNNDGLFAAYAEPCDLVESQVQAAAAELGAEWPAATFCANVSLSHCGFDGTIGVQASEN